MFHFDLNKVLMPNETQLLIFALKKLNVLPCCRQTPRLLVKMTSFYMPDQPLIFVSCVLAHPVYQNKDGLIDGERGYFAMLKMIHNAQIHMYISVDKRSSNMFSYPLKYVE